MKRTLLGYVPENSPVYRFHPFTRLFVIFVLTFIPLFLLDPWFNLPLALVVLTCFPLSGLRLGVLKYYLPFFVTLFCFVLGIYTLFPDPHLQTNELYSGWGVVLYQGALAHGLMVYLRIACVLLLTIYFLNVMTESEIVVALRSVRVPFVICYTLGLAFRAIGMFLEDYRTVREAEQARALDFRELPLHRKVIHLINYVIPLLALMIRRTDEFSDAILARGFSFREIGSRPNYLGRKYRFERLDYAGIIASVLLTLATLFFGLGLTRWTT